MEQPQHVEVPSYGYYLEESAGQITITVPERSAPRNAFSKNFTGCIGIVAALLVLLFAVPCGAVLFGLLGAMIAGSQSGAANTLFPIVGGVVAVLVVVAASYLLFVHERNRLARAARLYAKIVIVIQRDNILINGKAYIRNHVGRWTTRWTEVAGTSFVVGGSVPVAAGAMIGSALYTHDAREKAKQRYYITFDYGDQQIIAATGLTEGSAGRIMESIQTALGKV